MCVIGFINTFDSQSYDTNDSPWKYIIPVHSTKRNGYKYMCVCVPLRLPLANTLVSSDATPSRGGAGASIIGDSGAAASGGGGIIASAASIAELGSARFRQRNHNRR
jgi:hypothetical protein